jgi:hypothetical protein
MDTREKRILKVDSQLLTSFQKCEFYTFLSFVKDLRLKGDTPEPIEKGDLGHITLEAYYNALKKLDVNTEADFQAALSHAAEKGREHYQGLSLDIDTSEYIINTFYLYANHYRYDGLTIIDVEKVFMLKIYEDEEIEIWYEGKIDLIADVPRVGIIPIDHKFRHRTTNETNLNNQFMGYAVALNCNLVIVNEVGLQTSKKPKDKFKRKFVPFTKGMKDRWLKNTIIWAKRIDEALQTNQWPMSMASTTQGVQCLKCQFNGICASDNEEAMVEKIKQEYYIKEHWDVSKELSSGKEAHP